MTIMSKTSGASERLRGGIGTALPDGDGRALTNASEAWFSATAECQREMLGFMSMRLEKDGEAVREMMGCKTMADAAAVHSHWVEETLRDYNAEITRLMTIYTNSVSGGASLKR